MDGQGSELDLIIIGQFISFKIDRFDVLTSNLNEQMKKF